jgi:hypothetical protein
MQKESVEIRDIKPLLEIPDSSLYLYWGSIGVAVLLLFLLLYFIGLKWWRGRKENRKKYYLAQLKAIEWSDAKRAAYDATYYGRLLADDARTEEIYTQLIMLLEAYKYKKEVEGVSDETLKQFNLFVQVCDESI